MGLAQPFHRAQRAPPSDSETENEMTASSENETDHRDGRPLDIVYSDSLMRANVIPGELKMRLCIIQQSV